MANPVEGVDDATGHPPRCGITVRGPGRPGLGE